MVRRLMMSVALAIGLLAIAVSGLIVFRTMLAEAVLSSRLAALGIPAARLSVASLDLHRMVVTGIALGDEGEVRVDAASFAYSPGSLLEGRLEEAAIEGLRLRLDLSGAGPPLGSLQPLLQGGQGGGGAALLPAVVTLSGGEIVAVAPGGEVAAAVSGQWRPIAGTATLTLSDLALPHVALETSRLEIYATPDRIVATARAHGDRDALDLDLRATVESWRSDPRFALGLEASLAPAAWNIPPLPPVGEGGMAVSLKIDGRLPPVQGMPLDAAALDWLAGADLRGRLQASLNDIGYRDLAQGITGALDLAVTVAGGELRIELADDSQFRIARVDPALLDALGVSAVVPGLRDAGVTVTLPLSDAPLRLRLRPAADGADLAVSGAAGLAMAETALEVRADGALGLDDGFALRRVSFPRADIRLRQLTVGEYRLEELHFTGAIDGPPGDLEGTGDITADLGATRIETLAVGAAGIGLAADFRWIDRRLEIRQRGEGAASIASLALGKAARVARPFALGLADGALTLDMMPDGLALQHAIAIRPDAVTIDLPRPDAAALAIRAEAGTVLLEGGSQPGVPHRGKLTLAGGRLAIPDPGLAAEAVSASLVFPATAGERLAQFTIGQLTHRASPAYFAPLRVDGEIGRRKDALLLKATGAGGGFRLSLDGRHRIADGRGELQVRLQETAFRKGGLQPADLFPLLRDVREATGRAGGKATFAWGTDGLRSEGRLDMAGVSFRTDAASVEGLDSRISLDGLLPPSTVPGQEISVRRIDPGLPLDDVEAHFQLEPAAPVRLRLEDARAGFAGGRLNVAEAILDPSRSHNDFRVGVESVDLALLLSLLKAEGLSATGRISGTIPIVVIDHAVTIQNGQLAAEGPGVLRVQSKEAAAALGGAGEQVALMLNALEDFHYDALSATLDMEVDGNAAIMIHMQGNNPAVLEGYPFAFNIGLSGNLPKLLVALRQGAGVSTDLVRPQLR